MSNMWKRLGFHDFEHFVTWCPGCFGILVGAIGCSLLWALAVVIWALL